MTLSVPSYRPVLFAGGRQAKDLKSALEQKETAEAAKVAAQAKESAITILQKYMQNIRTSALIEAVVESDKPDSPRAEAALRVLEDRFNANPFPETRPLDFLGFSFSIPVLWKKSRKPYTDVNLLLTLRAKVAASGKTPESGSPVYRLASSLYENTYPSVENVSSESSERSIDTRLMDGYKPLFKPAQEARFQAWLLTQITMGNIADDVAVPVPSAKSASAYRSIPALVDFLDYTLTTEGTLPQGITEYRIKEISTQLENLVLKGAPPYALTPDQHKPLSTEETARAVIDLFKKKGYFQEEGKKELPQKLAQELIDAVSLPPEV